MGFLLILNFAVAVAASTRYCLPSAEPYFSIYRCEVSAAEDNEVPCCRRRILQKIKHK
jgi:hypothetical protein